MHDKLVEGQASSFIIKKEAWENLFVLFESADHADKAMALMLSDAKVRDETSWDWNTQGYGQTIFQLVQCASAVGADHVCEWVLEHREALRLTVNKDTLPNMMRKVAAAGGGVTQLERLYALEQSVMGRNTHGGVYELSRAYKRAGSVSQLSALLAAALAAGVELKPDFVEDTKAWLSKRGVQV
mmetsp:Transcript_25197/g.54767  ORF Transcript_25197/g.54767 Transcript_25197/m.54767 type:complete len:184 (-) Transcript_25197:136-687(-)